MHYAATYGHKDVVELLLANRADVNAKDYKGNTPLHDAVDNGYKDVAELLLQHDGQDMTAHDATIHEAAKSGNYEMVKVLLKANPDLVNSKDNNSATPLHYAAAMGYRDVAELLLANKADVNAKDNKGNTPLHVAVDNGYKDVAELLLQHDGQDMTAHDATNS